MEGGQMKIRIFALTLALGVLFGVCAGPLDAVANTFVIQGASGLTISPGDVGDNLTGGGVLIGGRLGFAVNDMIMVFGGGGFSFLGGADVNGVEVTDAAFLFTVEAGAVVYLIDRATSDVRPYVGGALGLGGLGWSYSDLAAAFFGTDTDGIGLVFAAPEVGVEIGLGGDLSLGIGTRFLLTGYGDTTSEDFAWDFSDGHFWQLYGTLAIEL